MSLSVPDRLDSRSEERYQRVYGRLRLLLLLLEVGLCGQPNHRQITARNTRARRTACIIIQTGVTLHWPSASFQLSTAAETRVHASSYVIQWRHHSTLLPPLSLSNHYCMPVMARISVSLWVTRLARVSGEYSQETSHMEELTSAA